MKSMLKITFYLVFTLALSLNVNVSNAQSRYQSTKSIALGGGGIAYTSDYNAMYINPANIYFRRANTFMTIGLARLNTQAGGSLLNVTAYNNYLTDGARYTVAEFRDKVVPAFFKGDEVKSFGAQIDILPIGFSYGNESWAISGAVRSRVITNTYMNSGAMKLLAGMNAEMFPTPTQIDFGQSVLAMGSFSLGFAMPVFAFNNSLGSHRIIAGIAPKVLFGVEYSSFDMKSIVEVNSGNYIKHTIDYKIYASGELNNSLDRFVTDKGQLDLKFADLFEENYTNPDDIVGDLGGINGNGFGLDLGLTYELIPNFMSDLYIRASFSITDIGKLNFTENSGIYGSVGEFNFGGVVLDQDRIDNEFNGEFGEYFNYILSDSLAENGYGNLQKRASSYSKSLPTMYNLGFMAEWNKMITLVTDFTKGIDEFGINSTKLIWSTGLEIKPFSFFPIRVGMRTGGSASTIFSAGTGLEFKNYEFSVSVAGTKTSESGLLLGVALSSLNIRF